MTVSTDIYIYTTSNWYDTKRNETKHEQKNNNKELHHIHREGVFRRTKLYLHIFGLVSNRTHPYVCMAVLMCTRCTHRDELALKRKYWFILFYFIFSLHSGRGSSNSFIFSTYTHTPHTILFCVFKFSDFLQLDFFFFIRIHLMMLMLLFSIPASIKLKFIFYTKFAIY